MIRGRSWRDDPNQVCTDSYMLSVQCLVGLIGTKKRSGYNERRRMIVICVDFREIDMMKKLLVLVILVVLLFGLHPVMAQDEGILLFTLQHDDYMKGAAWNSDESRIIAWSADGTARLWDAESGEQLLALWHEDAVLGAEWSSDERRVLTSSGDGTAKVWDVSSVMGD